MLYNAFGRAVPLFAHVPLILGPDKKRLSKRHGATSVTEYRTQGYLPEAMVNFLALLGWSPGNDQEVLTRDELVRAFSLDAISSNNAVFNPEKLDWFNGQHIIRMPLAELGRRVRPILEEAALWRAEYAGDRREWFERVLDLVRARARKLEDFAWQARPFLADTVEYDPEAVRKYLDVPDLARHVTAVASALDRVDPFEPVSIEAALRAVAQQNGLKAATLIHATRVAATGQSVSAGIFEVLALLGRGRTVDRLNRLVAFLSARTD
jgi:glutamyl-tRNA synthetase